MVWSRGSEKALQNDLAAGHACGAALCNQIKTLMGEKSYFSLERTKTSTSENKGCERGAYADPHPMRSSNIE